jgi:hypothetical protein
MSRLVVLVAALATLVPRAARAQMLTLGLRGGASISTMSVSGASPNSRTGFVAGPTGMAWLSDGLAIQFDALYVTKGFRANGADVTSSLSLSYLDVPITAVLSLPATGKGMLQARLQAGPSLGFRVQCSVDQGTGDVTGITDCNPDNVGTFDLGLVAGAGFKIGRGRSGFTIDATYTFGLLDVNLSSSAIAARNRDLMISAGVVFPIM